MNLTSHELLDAYRVMRTIRDFEERVHDEFAAGEIPGFVHLYAGEEASATGICAPLTDRDYIASTHRGHGHCIAKGVDVHGMMAELFGRRTGLCGGKGGSMHVADLELGMMGANGIVGGGPPLVTGAALTAKRAGKGDVAVAKDGQRHGLHDRLAVPRLGLPRRRPGCCYEARKQQGCSSCRRHRGGVVALQ